jgi:Skp family chaperone for outer membrane proteins
MTYLLKRLMSKFREQKDIGVTTTEVRGKHGSKLITMTPAEISAFHIAAREKKIAELEADLVDEKDLHGDALFAASEAEATVEYLREKVKELEAENNRLRLKHFQPVDERAIHGVRDNFLRINSNFGGLNLDLKMVNLGAEPNDFCGDSLRVAWIKVNENFAVIETDAGDKT